MSTGAKVIVGVIAAAVVLGIIGVPFWLIVVLIVGVPIAGYAMLDPTQRQRLWRNGRKQIGS